MNEINSFSSHNEQKETLLEWISEHHNEEDMREVFLNMDIALKYIHDHDYCVQTFHPSRIMVLNNMPNHIQFSNIMPIDHDSITRREMIKEDIFKSSLIQIALYTNTLKYLSPSFANFLKEKFDDFSKFIPEGDVSYYRGVIQRGAAVYFSEFAVEKARRDFEQLEKQVNEMDGKNSSNIPDSGMMQNTLENDTINDAIYKEISRVREAAFINSYIIPGIILITIIIILVVVFFV